MNTEFILIGIVIIIVIMIFIFKRNSSNKVPRRIKLDQLELVMNLLTAKKFEGDFFGITSNYIDCIYFADNKGKINIEFEVMTDDQKPYLDKIKEFAKMNGYQTTMTTYGNKPIYDDLRDAPVVKIESNADSKTATELGKRIMLDVFNCNTTMKFDIIP